MENINKFNNIRPLGVSDEEWGKICSTLISEGIRQEKQFHNDNKNYQDNFYTEVKDYQDNNLKYLEENQSSIKICDTNINRLIEKTGLKDYSISLPKEDISLYVKEASSGQNIPGWTDSRVIDREQTLSELLLMQDAAFIKAHTDPNIASLVKNFENYVIGTGIKISTINQEVNEVISRFRNLNKMAIKDKHIARGFFIDGEYFIIYNPIPKTGDVRIFRSPAREVTEIITDNGDRDTIIGYKREFENGNGKGFSEVYYPDINYFNLRDSKAISTNSNFRNSQFKTSKLMQFIKYGNDDEIRGRVPMQPILRFAKYYEDWLIDRVRLNHERSKVVWIRQIDPGVNGTTNISTNPFSVPKGGVMLTELPGLTYKIINAQINAGDSKDDGLAILYEIAGGMVFPLFIMTQRIDEASYSSQKKGDIPFVTMIESYQDLLRVNMKDMYKTVISFGIANGVLPAKTSVPKYILNDELIGDVVTKVGEMINDKKEQDYIINEAKKILNKQQKMTKINTVEIPIGIIFPPVFKDDILAQAKILSIYNSIGIASKATMSTMAGFDWNEERTKIIDEKKLGFGIPSGKVPQPGDTTIDGDRDINSDNEKDKDI